MSEGQELMLKRQIELNAAQVRERQMAMQLSQHREMTHWMLAFYGLAAPALVLRGRGNSNMLLPLFPLTFVVGYNVDLAYGNKISRIRGHAESMLNDENTRVRMLSLPNGEPTLEAIDNNLRNKGRIQK